MLEMQGNFTCMHKSQVCCVWVSVMLCSAAGGQHWARASGSTCLRFILGGEHLEPSLEVEPHTHTHTHREKRVWSALRGDGCSHARARVIWFTVMIWSQSRSLLQTCPESVPEHIVLKKSVCACCAEALKRILVFLQVRRALQECAREIPVSVRCAPQTVRDFCSCEHIYSISVCLSARVWRIWRCVFIMHVLWVECAFVDVHCWSFICIPVCVMF